MSENLRAVQTQWTGENTMAVRDLKTGTNQKVKVSCPTRGFPLELGDGQGVPEPTRTRKGAVREMFSEDWGRGQT